MAETNNSCNYFPTEYSLQVGGPDGTLVNLPPSVTSGYALVSNGSSANPSFQALSVQTISITFVSSSPYVVLDSGYFLSVDTTVIRTIQLPNAPATGRVIIVKDTTGLSGANQINVTTIGGVVTIDGATIFVINTNYESVQFVFDGTKYQAF